MGVRKMSAFQPFSGFDDLPSDGKNTLKAVIVTLTEWLRYRELCTVTALRRECSFYNTLLVILILFSNSPSSVIWHNKIYTQLLSFNRRVYILKQISGRSRVDYLTGIKSHPQNLLGGGPLNED